MSQKTNSGQTRSLPIEEWHALGQQGNPLPVTICLEGDSMRPLIRRGLDRVTILPLSRPLEIGDIVLFSDPGRKRYVLHRVWRTEGDRVLTWGDHCIGPDAWMPVSCIWGLAVKVKRGRLTLNTDSNAARRTGIAVAALWHHLRRLYLTLRRRAARLYHALKGDRK